MSKEFDVYVEYIESEEDFPGGECHGFMVSATYTNPGLRFYYKKGKNWICECYEYGTNSSDVYFVDEREVGGDLIDEKDKSSTPAKTIDKYLFNERISTENRKSIREFIAELEEETQSKIYHVVYNEIRGTFQKLEDGEDDSFWFTTSDYLLWYLKVLDSDSIYLEDKEEQKKLILDELAKRGLKL